MTRRIVAAAVSAALCSVSAWPVLAQDYRPGGFDAPAGATATVNVRVPIGASSERAEPSWGVTMAYGQRNGGQQLDGRTTVREVRVVDIRFSGTRVREANVASFDLAHLDEDRRLNFRGGGWWLPAVAVVALGVGVWLVADSDDDGPTL